LESLSDDFFVVAPDMRGFNLSDKPQGLEFYTLQELVNDALALVQHLGYETFNLLGHDWGGLMSWSLATLHPEVLDNLIIINSPHPRIHQQLLTHSKRQIAASQYVTKFLDDSAAEKLSRNDFDLMWRFAFNDLVEKGLFGEKEKTIYKAAWAQEGALEAMLSLYRAANFVIPVQNDELTGSLDATLPLANIITSDTLVFWGMADTALSSECLDGLDAYVENLDIVKIPGAGHCVIHEYPELISQSVRDFCL
jgi:pimeloyl-ACP methyl ester carboxylesterase